MSAPLILSDADLLARFHGAVNQPESSKLLGFRLVALSQTERWVEAEFTAAPHLSNPMGQVQGGFQTAMLDEVMSVAGLVASGMTAVMPTLEMKTSFFRAAQANGQVLRAVGRIVKWGKTIAFTEGELFAADGALVAKASGTAMPRSMARYNKE
jgi:uncharacterized protein (TIGR00369 family)